jgi:hypothetical protein
MRLVEYRLPRRLRPVLDRVDLVMDQAARMIGQRERGGLGQVEMAVTVTDGIPDLICAAHQQLFGRSDWDAWAGPGRAGTTTLNRSGSLVIVNAQSLHGRRDDIDRTVLHELTHAAQFSRPGARDRHAKGTAYNLGIGWLTDAELRAGDREMVRDEREAETAERLHRQLAKAVA